MGRITISETIDAPVETVFAYVDDYRNTTKYMKDLVKWEPTSDVTHGKGAKFESAMKAGPSTLNSAIDITTWTENRTIGWRSISGFKQTGKWSFKPRGDQTDATFEMEYEFGGGIAGRMLGRAAEPIVRQNLQTSVRSLKTQTEKLKSKSPAKSSASSGRGTKSSAKTPAKRSAAKSTRR
ncbi:MAG: SRPBCC family protein [Candidatus Dormibacteria bacterium]